MTLDVVTSFLPKTLLPSCLAASVLLLFLARDDLSGSSSDSSLLFEDKLGRRYRFKGGDVSEGLSRDLDRVLDLDLEYLLGDLDLDLEYDLEYDLE